MESLNPVFALCGNINKCAGTENVFFLISEVSTRAVILSSLLMATICLKFFDSNRFSYYFLREIFKDELILSGKEKWIKHNPNFRFN